MDKQSSFKEVAFSKSIINPNNYSYFPTRFLLVSSNSNLFYVCDLSYLITPNLAPGHKMLYTIKIGD